MGVCAGAEVMIRSHAVVGRRVCTPHSAFIRITVHLYGMEARFDRSTNCGEIIIAYHSFKIHESSEVGNPDVIWGKGDSGGPQQVVHSTRTGFGFSFVLHM
jgi:hypothetical protein